MDEHKVWTAGFQAGVDSGRGARKAYEEIATERLAVLRKAGKILEPGYISIGPTTANFKAACAAYRVIDDYFEQSDPTANKEQKEMSASEALYLFVGWLTSRGERVTMSASDEAAVAADLVSEFCEKHALTPPSLERVRQLNL